MRFICWLLLSFAVACTLESITAVSAEPAADKTSGKTSAPEVGKKAPDFALESVTGETVKLSKLVDKSPVVLVMLRGYPGYQCPICSRQVGELLRNADQLKKTGGASRSGLSWAGGGAQRACP